MFALKEFANPEDDESMSGSLQLGTLREISVLRMLSSLREDDLYRGHPNIMSLHDICVSEDRTLSMVMPRCSCNLTEAIKSNCLNSKQKLSITHQLLIAVGFLHKNDIIHRDIKSDNVLLDGDMNPILADFSLAKIFDGSENAPTHTDSVGTCTYKSPEVYQKETYGLVSDVYSLGVVLLELFDGILKIDKDKAAFRYVEEIRLKLSKTQALPQLLYKMLEPNPKKRITCEEALKMDVFKKFTYPKLEKTINKKIRARERKSTDETPRKKARRKESAETEEELAECCYEMLEFSNPLTKQAALIYHTISQEPMEHCMVLAGKMFESDLLDMTCVDDFVEDFDIDEYLDAEMNIFKAVDFCLYI